MWGAVVQDCGALLLLSVQLSRLTLTHPKNRGASACNRSAPTYTHVILSDVSLDLEAGIPSGEVTIIAGGKTPIKPIPDRYEVDQVGTDAFKADVWLRRDATHTLTFADYGDTDATTHSGFRFVELFRTRLTGEVAADSVAVSSTIAAVFVAPTDDTTTDTVDESVVPATDAAPYYTVSVSKTSPIELVADTATTPTHKGLTIGSSAGDPPTLTFKVTGTGTARVTITYHVAVGRNVDDTDAIEADEWRYESDSKVLTLNIIPSS